ncbi:tRNA(1-methyladenosine) methyltransferase-like methyltransferase [Candidatus Methanoperedens nitroreducens]|uniref:tRNA(1-methyladenosine) methyltransferase-like methyltransferase n=1 Tax=Candidatus Methanoperedens nitratireducens TaxID=1392998 RepID=A0A062V368_9EURY|nr:methyltransferase domain-containing protein [Candidatus Methanoperedens nitroreducens]KCZ73511.1 tRNA(1-methyladenosine) methyltransferase-like methyltransferase [Candidatus Methanoperedens nitroreducens]MDJ1422533.1 methyltransferase domain-containing protein [Candidatus Methanoperedens sp.]
MDTPVILKTYYKGKVKEYFAMPEGELHTDLGVIKLEELRTKSFGDRITSHLGIEFVIQKPRAPDLFAHAKRSGAPMMPKDIGVIISNTGLCSSDYVLDAGTGSGILAIYLGGIAKKVISYEIRDEFIGIAQQNMDLAGLSNVELRHGDIVAEIQKLDERFDVITLDTGDAPAVIPHIPRVIYSGGFLAVYSPFFEQTKEIRDALGKTDFTEVRTIETLEREISFTERGTRPATARVGHTGFITIARY